MLDATKFSFRFKGNRDYIQGGDIFDELDAWFRQHDYSVRELVFRDFARKQLRCVFRASESGVKAQGTALDNQDNHMPFWLLETAEPVTERYAFDEEAITNQARITGQTIEADAVTGYSVIEQVIALTKKLNYALAPDINGKWVFGQLRLREALPTTVAHLKILQKTMLAGRFSVQEVTLDDRVVGQIRFITSQS